MEIPRTYPIHGGHVPKVAPVADELFPSILVSERGSAILVAIATDNHGRNIQLRTTFGNKLYVSYTYRTGRKVVSADKKSRKTEKTVTAMWHIVQLPAKVNVQRAFVEYGSGALLITLPIERGWPLLRRAKRGG